MHAYCTCPGSTCLYLPIVPHYPRTPYTHHPAVLPVPARLVEHSRVSLPRTCTATHVWVRSSRLNCLPVATIAPMEGLFSDWTSLRTPFVPVPALQHLHLPRLIHTACGLPLNAPPGWIPPYTMPRLPALFVVEHYRYRCGILPFRHGSYYCSATTA